MIPRRDTNMRLVYDALHAEYHGERHALDDPTCDEWAYDWENRGTFTGDDIQLAVITAFEVLNPEKELFGKPVPAETEIDGRGVIEEVYSYSDHTKFFIRLPLTEKTLGYHPSTLKSCPVRVVDDPDDPLVGF